MRIFILVVRINFIPKYNYLLSLATPYFISNIFCSNVCTNYFCTPWLKLKTGENNKKSIHILQSTYRVFQFKSCDWIKPSLGTIPFWVVSRRFSNCRFYYYSFSLNCNLKDNLDEGTLLPVLLSPYDHVPTFHFPRYYVPCIGLRQPCIPYFYSSSSALDKRN